MDEVEAQILDHPDGVCHDAGIATKKLGRDGMLVFVEVQVAFGLLIFLAEYTVGRGELGHDQAASAEVADEAAEDSVGPSGHGGEDGCGVDVDGAVRETLGG